MASTSGSYFRSITPSLVSGHRYPHPNRDLRYSPTQGFVSQPSSLAQALYTPQSQQYAAHGLPMAPAEENMPLPDHTTQPTRFIPTPSQIAHAYSTYPQQMASSALQAELYDPSSLDYTGTSPMVSTNNLHRRHSRTLSVRPRGGSVANSVSSASTAASPSGERFPCEKCGKTFSRSHDRKRHYETQHLPSPIVHRCVYCHKEFSRCVFLFISVFRFLSIDPFKSFHSFDHQ